MWYATSWFYLNQPLDDQLIRNELAKRWSTVRICLHTRDSLGVGLSIRQGGRDNHWIIRGRSGKVVALSHSLPVTAEGVS